MMFYVGHAPNRHFVLIDLWMPYNRSSGHQRSWFIQSSVSISADEGENVGDGILVVVHHIPLFGLMGRVWNYLLMVMVMLGGRSEVYICLKGVSFFMTTYIISITIDEKQQNGR